ncbi:hypothetical protein HRbin02_01223 [Candidatus Calditenuaceae archaeon HR02]|nr:hypothetical protein HRbin02_01223 [Candidatus Calditenuaceae archaeon HR02]
MVSIGATLLAILAVLVVLRPSIGLLTAIKGMTAMKYLAVLLIPKLVQVA